MAVGRISCFGTALVFVLHVGASMAEDDCATQSDDCVAVGRWNFSVALGVGDRTNPVTHAKDIPLVIIPQFSYYGKRVFIEDLDVGFTLADGDVNTLNLVASPGYDRVFFYRSDLQNIFVGPVTSRSSSPDHVPVTLDASSATAAIRTRPRRITYLAGPEWTFKYGGMTGQLDYLHEITAQNHGDEVRAALAIPLGRLGGAWSADLGVTWKSSAIVNYYYGAPDVYTAGPALNPFVKLSYTRPLSSKWKLTAFVHYEHLASAIANSPIIAQRHVTTAFFGVVYEFRK
jgi:outer membrane protein